MMCIFLWGDYQLKASTELLGNGATVNADGSAQDEYKTVGGALEALDKGVVNNTTNITNLENKTGQSLTGIEEALGGGAKFDENGKLDMPNYKTALAADKDLKSVEAGFEYVGGKLIEHGDQITNIEGDITNITSGKSGLVQLSDEGEIVIDNTLADNATFNLANADGTARQLTGVKDGELSTTSTDAVNGSQLHTTNTNVENLDGRVTINEGNISTIQGDITNITNKTGQSLTGIEEALGGGAKFDENGKLDMPNYKNALTADKDLKSVEAGFEYVGGQLIEHGDQITNIEGDITNITSGKSGLVQLSDEGEIVIDNTLADNATFNLANADGTARQLTGVKDGELSTTSTDAVNGSQLHTTNTNVENLDGRVTINEDNISTIQGDITNITNKTGQSLTGIEDAFGAGAEFDENGKLDMPNYKDALTADKDLKSVEAGFEYVNGKLTGITTGTAGLIKLSDDSKSLVVDNSLAKDATVFDFSNNGTDRTLTGVAKGKLDNDAVNVSQLKKVTDGLGGGSEVDEDGNVTGPTYNITNKEGDNIVHNNVGDALTEIDQSVTNITNKTGNSLTGIEDAFGGGAKFDKDGNLKMPNYKDALTADKDLESVEAGFEYVGGQLIEHGEQITNIEGDVTNLDNRVTVNEGDIKNITEGKSGLVQVKNGQIVFDNEVDGANGAVFNIANRDGSVRKIDGVAEAALHDKSNEAVSGKQLNATNESIAKSLGGEATYSGGDLADLNFRKALKADGDITTVYDGFEYLKDNLQSVEDGEAGLLQLQDGKLVFSEKALGATFDITDGKDARTLTGVKAGAVTETSLDAINGSQLHTTNKSIVDSLGGGAELNDDGSIKGPTYVINNGDSYNNVGDAITNIDGRVIKRS